MDASKHTDAWKTESPAYAAFPGPAPSTAQPLSTDKTRATTPAQYVIPVTVAIPVENHAAYTQSPPTPTPTPTAQLSAQPQTCRDRLASWVYRIPLLLLFHVANFALGLTAFILVVTLVPLSVGLIPLCCIGVVVFRITAWVAEYLAIVDIALANLVASKDDEKLRVHPRIRSGRQYSDSDDSRRSAFAWLQFVTPQNLGAMLYFATLKFAVSILSCVVAGLVTGLPMGMIGIAGVPGVQPYGITFDDHPVWYVLSTVGATLLGVLLLPVVATLSRKLTKIACAEKSRFDAPSTPAGSFV